MRVVVQISWEGTIPAAGASVEAQHHFRPRNRKDAPMPPIKRTRTALLFIALGLFTSTAFGGPAQLPSVAAPPTTAPSLESSKERIYRQLLQDQQDTIARLAAQCTQLASENARLTRQLTLVGRTLNEQAQNPTPGENIPKDWRQENINGMTFYLVPIEKLNGAAAGPDR
jgi:uncharacterized protein HemX